MDLESVLMRLQKAGVSVGLSTAPSGHMVAKWNVNGREICEEYVRAADRPQLPGEFAVWLLEAARRHYPDASL